MIEERARGWASEWSWTDDDRRNNATGRMSQRMGPGGSTGALSEGFPTAYPLAPVHVYTAQGVCKKALSTQLSNALLF